MQPNAPVTEMQTLRPASGLADPAAQAGADTTVQLHTAQSRVFMAAGETVSFSLQALTSEGTALPLVVTQAAAQGMTYAGARPTSQVALTFADSGDGALAANFSPAEGALAAFAGTIRTQVRYKVAGRDGVALFDVIYTPEPPAQWTGAPRDVVDNGSLVFILPAQMRQAGRYIVTGRIDDANGVPFALASFNEVLPAGPNEIRLTVFGKLLRDAAPVLPLTLRDVDGYLLKENADPDRALMARLEGTQTLSKVYAIDAFSDAEWHSEERTRYLGEYARDALNARARLAGINPGAALASPPCAIAAPQAVK